MGIRSTPVSKCLDKKLLVMGFEIPDLLAIFLTLSILNFIFGQTALKVPFVWAPAVLLAIALRLGKRGKPDNYLIHWLRFQIKPARILAFDSPSKWENPPRSMGNVNAK